MELLGFPPNMIGYLERFALKTHIYWCTHEKDLGFMWVWVLLLIWGAVIWKKVRIPDSFLLVYSKIATMLDNNSALNKNRFMKILSPLSEIKTLPQEVGGTTSYSHMFSPYSVSSLNLLLK